MSEEQQVLRARVLSKKTKAKRKGEQLSFRVRAWLFFKKYLLEDVPQRQHFSASVLSYYDFCQELRTEVNLQKYAPAEARASPSDIVSSKGRKARLLLKLCFEWYEQLLSPNSAFTVCDGITGLGVMPRADVSVKPGISIPDLKGFLEPIPEGIDEEVLKDYPSLLEHDTLGQCICAGPLSLVNHRCGCALRFFPIGKALHIRSPYRCLRLKAGEEVFVYYGAFYLRRRGTACLCPDCAGNNNNKVVSK